MIPADVASRLQVSADAALRPVAPTQEIADKLSDLVAGQRVMASIQSLLPNGTYRALINQRSITLALPFSAKAGDSLELQVTESDGKLALAVVSRPEESSAQGQTHTVSATLSRTGQLISDLFSSKQPSGKTSQALPLNGNQAIANTPPAQAKDLLPLLKQAITQSGMFYESHQAEWIEGRLSKNALLQEPQGKLSSSLAFAPETHDVALTPGKPALPAAEQIAAPATRQVADTSSNAPATRQVVDTSSNAPANSITDNARPSLQQQTASGQQISAQIQPLVQQQLEALATQTYTWQGQVWPGQDMRWEIEEDASRQFMSGDDPAANWRTSLHLTLPRLGEIDAQIRIQGEQIVLRITSENPDTRQLLRMENDSLRQLLSEAGLSLASLGISANTADRTHGETAE